MKPNSFLIKPMMPIRNSAILFTTVVLAFASCVKEPPSGDNRINQIDIRNSPPPPSSLDVPLIHVMRDIEDADMLFPLSDTTLLWNRQGHKPILAPDNHQITLAEFNQPSGYAEI